ncbi:MAG: alginate export family protein [Nitrospirota bacterium]
MRNVARLFLLISVVLCFASSVYAEHLFGPDELDTTYGAVFRLRQELWENAFDVDTLGRKNDNFFRLKSSVFVNFEYAKKYGLFVKLTNEARYYINSGAAANNSFDEDEIIFDNLYADFKNAFGLPVDVRLGRQDFLNYFGEGFLVMDGTPADGSRTFFFNAARVTWKPHKNHSVDFVYITDPRTDIYLPIAYSATKKSLTTSDEQGFVVYGKNKILDTLQVEPYYIHKTEDSFSTVSRLRLNTVGARAVFTYSGWKLRGEYAHQFGEYTNGTDRKGDGGYVFVGRKYDKVMWKPEFDLGYVYMSGDDPATTTEIESWNPLFSRWPIYSELLVFTLANETTALGGGVPAYWTNMHIYRANVKLNFTDATNLNLWYNYLRADERTSALNANMFSNSGKERGHLYQAMVSHKFSKKVDGYVLTEYFDPGDFYGRAADNALFFRWQLQVKL